MTVSAAQDHVAAADPAPMGNGAPVLAMNDEMILTLNCGSSSLKFAVFSLIAEPRRLLHGAVVRIGADDSALRVVNETGDAIIDEAAPCVNHPAALDWAMTRLEAVVNVSDILYVGHRVVHGGPDCDCPKPVTAQLEARLRRLIPLAPLHLPANLEGIVAARLRLPRARHLACFDTAFHQSASMLARRTGLPRAVEQNEIRRYGYHGLSYEFIVDHLRRNEGEDAAAAPLIVAHLGAGASMAAISNGQSVDTTMGFSTLSGLPMATRCGDIDPGLVLYLLQEKGWSASDLQALLYEQSGLLGLSGRSGDMQALMATPADADAREAIDFFCFQARKRIGALAAAMGRISRIVFTGGIGAHAPEIRAQILRPLEALLPLRLDNARNADNDPLISSDGSLIKLNALNTDEELVVARHTAAFARGEGALARIHQ